MKQLHFLGVASLALLFSCQSSNKKDYVDEDSGEIEQVEEAEIIFDETQGEADITKNFYFLFDGSGSMEDDCANERKIDGAKEAIFKFLEKVPDEINIGLLIFGVDNEYGIEEYVPLGLANREDFKQTIQNMEPTGDTPLGNATYYGIDALVEQYKKQLGYGEYRLIIVSDGLATDPDQFEESLLYSRKYPFIAIYGIGLCLEQEHILRDFAISYTDAYNYEELGKALEETIAELPEFDPTEFVPDEGLTE
ncbi:MAG: VWA domain-containing protein [Bacteroidales bacterium]|nr:VWA domain-containing protein [Bacteroidales bacterium]